MKGISSSPSCGAFVMELFHSRTNAHMQHLRTRSFAAHMALGTYYDKIVDLTDHLVEAYQGRYGLIDYPEVPFKQDSDPITMLKGLRRYIDDNRLGMTPYSELQNIIDEIIGLYLSTLYKLRFLA